MSCTRVRDELRSGRLLESPELARHRASCPRCAELLADEAELGRALANPLLTPSVPPRLWTAVEAELAREIGIRARLRSLPTWQRVVLCAAPVLLVLAWGLRGQAIPLGERASSLAWGLAFGTLALASAAVLLRPFWRGPWPRIVHAGLVALVLLLPLAQVLDPGLMAEGAHGAPTTAVGCFMMGVLLGLPFVLTTWLVGRATRVTPSALVLLAGAGGLVANLGLVLHCLKHEPGHLLAGHGAIGLVLLAVAAVTRRVVARS